MKKRSFTLLLAGLCLLFGVLFAACSSEQDGQVLHNDSIGALSTPDETLPLRDVHLKIDASDLTRPYNARPVNYPSCTAEVPEPRVAFTWYQKVGKEYKEILDPPTFVGSYRVTASVIDGMGYTGEDTVDFSITPAYLTPAANGAFPYSGATIFAVDAIPACGEDRISFDVAFDNANVGAEISYIRLRGENAENYQMDPAYTAEILPVELDISALKEFAVQKVYDATAFVRCTLDHEDLSGIVRGDTATVLFSAQAFDACAQTKVAATVVRSENPNYVFSGTADLLLTVEKAIFTPPVEVLYTGTSKITLQLETGIGADVLTLILDFESANVGAALLENGARIEGEQAGNYVLAKEYHVSILPRRLELSDWGEIHVKKRFDGTGRVCVTLSLDSLNGVMAESPLQIFGTVAQIVPCDEKRVLFCAEELSDPNYLIDAEFEICLTVEKAVLKIHGKPYFPYNGYAQRALAFDSIFVRGGIANYPVALTILFASAAPDAAFLGVSVSGENSAYYELDVTNFVPKITPIRLRFNVKNLNFSANGDNIRVMQAGRSMWLSAVAQGDEVYALLTFSSAEAGATLEQVTLYGADAYKYKIDISNFTATIE